MRGEGRAPGEVVLSYADLALAEGRRTLSGEIRAGEIVGLAGLEGQGQETFLRILAGLDPAPSGRAWLGEPGGLAISGHAQASRRGVAYLPRDRRTTGIFPALSVLDNFGLPSMPRFSRMGILSRRRQRESLARFAAFLSIRYSEMTAPITSLSGGNQQKVLLARWLAMEPRALLLDDPTRGVDLATRLRFYEAFRDLTARSGLALVVLSSEIEELVELCDRVMIFRDHELHRALDRAETTADGVLAAMFGQAA